MNVLHVITTLDRGGAENHLCELVKSQIRAGHTARIAYLKGGGYWRKTLEAAGASCFPIDISGYGDWSAIRKLATIIEQLSPQIVHAHLPPAELLARLALSRTQTAPTFVISKHNDTDFIPSANALVRWLGNLIGRWVGRSAKSMICISQSTADRVVSQGFASPSDVRVIYYGLNTDPFDKVSESDVHEIRTNYNADGPVVGTIARMVAQKRLDILLRSFAAFRENYAQTAKLVVVGDGPLKSELHRLSALLGIEDACIWLGFREDVPALLRTFDVFALTSMWEGFGLVLLEAMAAGRAIVASRVSAIPEVVRDEQTGLLVSPLDVPAFAHAFGRLQDAQLRHRLGLAGRARAREFSLDSVHNLTAAVYRDALTDAPNVKPFKPELSA